MFDFGDSTSKTTTDASLASLFASSAGPSKAFAASSVLTKKNALMSIKNAEKEERIRSGEKRKRHGDGGGEEDEDSKKNGRDDGTTDNNEVKRSRREKKKDKFSPEQEEEKNSRTIFVGNVSVDADQKEFKQLFKQFGEIESIRFRSIPVESLKVPRKAAFIKHMIRDSRDSMNAYVVFKNADSVDEAVKKSNGTEWDGKHLRVDRVGQQAKKFNPRLSIFIGNLPFDVEEEALRAHFAQSCPNITGVRAIRDKATNIGKGFAYISFENIDGVNAALKLHESDFRGRKLRISRSFNAGTTGAGAAANKKFGGSGDNNNNNNNNNYNSGFNRNSNYNNKSPSSSSSSGGPPASKKDKKELRKLARAQGTHPRAQRRAAMSK